MRMQGSSPRSAALYAQLFDALRYRATESTSQRVSGFAIALSGSHLHSITVAKTLT
jgi:hypothetical protein